MAATESGPLAETVAEACEQLMRSLMIEGYEGAALHDAFARMKNVVVNAVVRAASTQVASVDRLASKKANGRSGGKTARHPDPRQREMLYLISPTKPASPVASKLHRSPGAERQARYRERLRARRASRDVTRDPPQDIENIGEASRVTRSDGGQRNASGQPTEKTGKFHGVTVRNASRGRQKEIPPHPPKKNKYPLTPLGGRSVTSIKVMVADPLFAELEAIRGSSQNRGMAYWFFSPAEVEEAKRRLSARAHGPPVARTG
jgi:hypothetical protein